MNFTPNPLVYGAHEDFLSSFKIVITMRDSVDHALLVDVVNSAMKRYPYSAEWLLDLRERINRAIAENL